MKEPIFRGAATALVTPFSNHDIDFDAYDRILQGQLEAGIPALVVTGTTGEASTLSEIEKVSLWHHTVQAVEGRCKVIAGIGTNCTETSCRLAELAYRAGADGLLAVTPYYNKCTQQGLLAHYTNIADTTPLPLIVYNVPSRTGVNLLPETCLALSRHPNINGVKEAGGSISQLAKILSLCEEFYVWSGNDDQITASMALGAVGAISVLSNIRPNMVVSMTEAALRGDFSTAARLQLEALPLIDTLFSQVNPIPVKAALSAMGLCRNELRLPLTAMEEPPEL